MADWTGVGVATADRYREMALEGFTDRSPSYRALALAVAGDPALCARLERLPPPKRQPNLLLGAVRFLDGPVADPAAFLTWCHEHWDDVVDVVRTHRTQTNEARRCTALLPVLAAVPGPLALVEVGASAGLCLQPDRYAYRYAGPDGEQGVGASSLTLECATSGEVPVPAAVPEIVWRRGLDLHPLDVTSADDVRWLECLVWPEQTERFEILAAAVAIARADPPVVVRGDLLADLADLVADAPTDATVVLTHSAVLAYLGPADRAAFVASLRALPRPVVWVSNEAPGVVVTPSAVPPGAAGHFLLARDGVPLAFAGQHGHSLRWLDPADRPGP